MWDGFNEEMDQALPEHEAGNSNEGVNPEVHSNGPMVSIEEAEPSWDYAVAGPSTSSGTESQEGEENHLTADEMFLMGDRSYTTLEPVEAGSTIWNQFYAGMASNMSFPHVTEPTMEEPIEEGDLSGLSSSAIDQTGAGSVNQDAPSEEEAAVPVEEGRPVEEEPAAQPGRVRVMPFLIRLDLTVYTLLPMEEGDRYQPVTVEREPTRRYPDRVRRRPALYQA